jgi:hypothetical protein
LRSKCTGQESAPSDSASPSLSSRVSLAVLDCATGAAERGADEARQLVALRQAALPATDWRIAELQSVLGACLGHVGQRAAAAALQRDALERLQATLGADHRLTRKAARYLEAASSGPY